MIKDPGYRLNVGVIVVNHKGKLLLCKRKQSNNWQFPQGGIDSGEEPESAAYRELYEEVGINKDSVKTLAISKDWHKYNLYHYVDIINDLYFANIRSPFISWN